MKSKKAIWAASLAACALALAPPSASAAQEGSALPIDEDALFGETVLRDYDPQEAANKLEASGASLPATVRVGGTGGYSALSGTWKLTGGMPQSTAGSGSAYANAYIDARPDDLTRFYLEGRLAYDKDSGFSGTLSEAFADASLDGAFRVRLGKQRVSWGVGYYYSPADVLSLEAIDVDDPAKKRSGPFAAKFDLPIGVQNLTLYAVLPEGLGLEALALAPRAEFLLGGFEATLAGYWRADGLVRPRLIAMATGALGDFDVYAESVLAWGADRNWIRLADDGTIAWSRDGDGLYAQATAGFNWSWTHPEQTVSLSLRAQYLYNGQGYADASLLRERAARLKKLVEAGTLSASDLALTGIHYLSASLGLGRLALDRVSLNLSGVANLSEPSFRVTASATMKPTPVISLKSSAAAAFGEDASEYAPRGVLVTPSFRAGYKDALAFELSLPSTLSGSLSSGLVADTVSLKATLSLSISAF